GYLNSIGIVQRHFTEDVLGHGSATVVLAGSIQIAALSLVGSPAGVACERHGYRAVLVAGCAVAMAGLLLASFVGADNLWLLVVSHGVMLGSAAALICVPATSIPSVWFRRHRGLANGLLMAGNGVSGLAFPPLIQMLIERVGVHWTFRILIAVFAVLGLAPSCCIRERTAAGRPSGGSPRTTLRRAVAAVFNFPLLRNRPYLAFAAANVVCGTVFYLPYQYVPTYATRHGSTPRQAALTAVLIGVGQIAGGLGGGIMIDGIGVFNTLVAMQLLSTVSTAAVWAVGQRFGVLALFCVLYGASSCGTLYLTISPLVAALFDVAQVPSAIGLVYVAFGVGELAMLGAYSPLEDVDPVDMRAIIALCGAMNLGGLVLCMVSRWLVSPRIAARV
ncbi:MFS general substrate transporter, partial [Ramicandelaber brevisporus]